MMVVTLRSGVVAALLLVAATAHAGAGRIAVTPKASTLGLGADVSFKIKERLSLRVMGQQFGYDTKGRVDGVDYDLDLDLQSFGTLVDLFPSGSGFRLSAGLLANGNELNTSARLDPGESYDIGGGTFTGAALGTMDGRVTFAPAAPFAGVGWGNPFKKGQRLSFSADLGVAHQPIDTAQLRSSNPLANPLIDQEMEDEERRFEEDAERLELYPVVSVGLTVLF